MKLLYDLPESEKKIVSDATSGAEILFCTPFDLTMDYNYTEDGWLVLTRGMGLILLSGVILRSFSITEGQSYRSTSMLSNGYLEGTFDDEPEILVRYSNEHLARYSYIVKALNSLSRSAETKIKSVDDEMKCPICGRRFAYGVRKCPVCTKKTELFKKLLAVARPYWHIYVLAILLFITGTALTLYLPMLNRDLIDHSLTAPFPKTIFPLLTSIGMIAIFNFLSSFNGAFRARVLLKAGLFMTRDMKQKMFDKYQAVSVGFIEYKRPGDLLQRLYNDVNAIQGFIQSMLSNVIVQVLLTLGVAVILFTFNWRLAAFILLPVPFTLIFFRKLFYKMRKMFFIQYHKISRLNSHLQNVLSGIRVVKAFGQEDREIEKFKSNSQTIFNISKKFETYQVTITSIISFCFGIGSFLILYFGGKLIIGGELTYGEYLQFASYTGFLYGGLEVLGVFPRSYGSFIASTQRAFEILDEEPEIKDKPDAVKMKLKGHVEIDNITFGYRSHEPVLTDVTLDVMPGEMIGLVGHSGAGKSTLINLIMRLYDVDEGNIRIDGVDLRDISHESFKSQIGVVLQETFLFSGTIAENIMYSKPGATPDEVIRAAKIANAHEFIINFPNGYDTKVGERGYRLSGGERQRIAIARAVLNNPKILILDEATASVDTETEQKIQEALGRLIKNRTTFAIAHRLSTLKNATRLVVIEKGRITEVGSHDELMQMRGIYHRLVMAQRKMSKMQAM